MDKGKPPLYFNFNFFDGIPDYHLVGTMEMFVAFKLQIGLEAQVNGLRGDHVSYNEGQVLNAQPLLKAYKDVHEKSDEVNISLTSVPSSLTEKSESQNDFELISSVPEGNFVNCKYWLLGKKKITGKGTAPI
eukprot:4193013-Ditylum_brightwellii.AAC.2